MSILVLITTGVCVALFTVSQWRNSDLKVKSDIKYNEALIENVGKPQIIEQRYFNPAKNDKSN